MGSGGDGCKDKHHDRYERGHPRGAFWFSTSDIGRARARGIARFALVRPIIPMDCLTSIADPVGARRLQTCMQPIMPIAAKAAAFAGYSARFSQRRSVQWPSLS